MPVTINGTSGVVSPDGSAGTPVYQGTDANTGMFFPAADTIAFAEGGVEVARFNADAQFVVTAGTVSLPVITTTGDTNTGIFFPAADTIAFTEGGAESARFDSSGNFLVGTASALGNTAKVQISNGTGRAITTAGSSGDVSTEALRIGKFDNNSTTSQLFVRFTINNDSAGSGQINANGASSAAFGSFSDERLKENIVDLPAQLPNICALRPVEFDYKDGSGHQIGFIAQEMQAVYPDVVGAGDNDMLMITGWSKTEARLVKAIQEQQALITSLTARIAALEGAAQ